MSHEVPQEFLNGDYVDNSLWDVRDASVDQGDAERERTLLSKHSLKLYMLMRAGEITKNEHDIFAQKIKQQAEYSNTVDNNFIP